MRKIVVATHGKMSQGIVNTLGIIIGEENTKLIDTYGLFPGQDVNEIAEKIEKEIITSSDKKQDFVILTDLAGGSVDNAVLKFVSYPNVWVVSGVNLILLLDLMLSDPAAATQSILEDAVENGKAGIILRDDWPGIESQEEDDL